MDDLLQEFLTETNESLAVLDVELVRFEREPSDAGILGNIFRLMHTIKGTCGFLGLPRLESVAHAGENVLGKYRDGEIAVTADSVTLILKAIDRIREILGAMQETGAEPAGDDSALIAELNATASGETASATAAGPVSSVADGDPLIEDAGFPVAAELLAEVAQAIEQKDNALTPEPAPAPAAPVLAKGVEKKAEAAKPAGEPASENREAVSSIRVNVDVIENLMTLISELVLTRNQLMQLQRSQKGSEFKVPLQRLSHITSDLQDGVTRMRMQPIGNAWAKLPRIVRDLSVETKKRIELVMQGADTELDRQVLEIIKDPLTHMVRNSADHGIEPAVARLSAGKPETGTITLKAYHESGHIFIRISDDGRGLDADRIRRKILANGLATETELAAMSEQQVLQFIFRAGFSTAEQVTSVSGRGVGMDVVRTNIERIGGTIEMTSVMGQGTTFLIKIPLTLAIVSALIVEAASQRFAIPQLNVIELVGASDRSEVTIQQINNAPVLRLRDRLLPLVSLRSLLNLGEPESNPSRTDYVVVAQVGAAKFGIIVDRVFDTEEIVVKPVAPILRGTPFYAGNTILGDGSVIMILDPNGISTTARQVSGEDAANADQGASGEFASDESAFLLFRTQSEELKAVPLELVARIEEFDVTAIEHVGGRNVVQYRDQLMPLVPFDGAQWKVEGKQAALVFSDKGRSMGLAVDEVVDIVRDRMEIEIVSEQTSLLGSAIIAGKATDIVNVGHFLTLAFDDWFGASEVEHVQNSQKRALVVDDSAFFRNLLVPQLRAANWVVTTAANGAEALALMEKERAFDLVISDIEMPEMDGLAFVSAVRSDSRWNDLPMIALSRNASESDVEKGRAAGFDDYLSKYDQPAMPSALARAMAAAVHSRSIAQERIAS
jgi:two-component system chemotaxis sensor kinase CheA